jgi:hypothetical protein
MGGFVGVLVRSLVYAASAVLVAWVAGALYYDLGRSTRRGTLLAVAWVLVAGALLVLWQPVWKPLLLVLVLFGLVLAWWLSQRPSNQRDWDPAFSRLARARVEGDRVTVENVRNIEYRTYDDYDLRYETRSYRLSQLRGADVMLLYWGAGWWCHPMLVFDFGDDGRLCVSIEVRRRCGQDYAVLPSLYRQQELTYVVSDERDAILRRTRCLPKHDLYLFRMNPLETDFREVFREYVAELNDLVDHPRWYHALTANCTTMIYRQRKGQIGWDWRLLINGRLDELLYDLKRLDQSRPLAELKRLSWVNEIANRAPREEFSDYIRRELPGYQPLRA